MIVIVSGHRRTGTSMMMLALHAAGMQALYNPILNNKDCKLDPEGYAPNAKAGLFEVGYYALLDPLFFRKLVEHPDDGFIVKIPWDCIVYLPKGDWKIVFMHRDAEEIDRSCARVDKYLEEYGDKVALENRMKQLIPTSKALPFSIYKKYNQDDIDHVLGIMETRSDVELIPVQYQDVIDDPVKVFKRLKYTPLGKERLPIDIEKAAATINPDFHRIRK
jgi:hypothetical protein